MLLLRLLVGVVTAWSMRVTTKDDLTPDISPSCRPFPHKRIVMVSFSSSFIDFLTNWFVTSAKFLVDDDVVVVVAEDDAALSMITDASMVQQLGRPFALMDVDSRFVDFDGQVPRAKTVDLPSFVSKGDYGSEEYATVTKGKPVHMFTLLQQGCTVHWTDIDAVWNASLWDVFASAGSHDLYLVDDAKEPFWPGLWNLCTCQMYVQPTDTVIKLFQDWINNCDYSKPEDQIVFNSVLRSDHEGNKTVDFVLMDRAAFPSGAAPVTDAAKVIHANWMPTVERKVWYLSSHNVWFPLARE
jgi:hypothetical protein